MAQAILLRGGAGGVTSDDVTASKAQVLQGYKTVTTDSNDEIVEGTIPNRGNIVDTVEFVNAHWDSKFLARMEEGYYSQNGQYKPCVAIPYAVLANVAGIDANKMLDTLTVAGTRGTIPNRGTWNTASEVVNTPWENTIHTRFEEGYYPRDGNFKPTAKIHYAVLVNVLGVDNSKMLDTLTIAGRQGQIKSIDTAASNYRINKSFVFGIDNWTNPSNPVFYVDFPHGNGYYNRPDGHPHVCIDAINLGDVTADKVMRGFTATSKNGVKFAGTMPDYSSGRVAFRNATFDGTLVSGVANVGLGSNFRSYTKPSTEIRDGIIRFSDTSSASGGGLHEYRKDRVLEESVTLAHSVNLTPFRTIRLGLKYPYGGKWGTVGGVGALVGVVWALPSSLPANYIPSINSKINASVIKKVGYKDGIVPITSGQWNTLVEIPNGAEYFVDVDVSELQGHHRIAVGIAVSSPNRQEATIQVNVVVNNSISGISHIEFIN